MTSPPCTIQDPIFSKTDTHPTITSSNSDSGKPHATLHNHLTPSANISTYGKPFDGTKTPDKLGGDLFFRANTLFDKEESATHWLDCNTVGPVPVASGYGSRTLTKSAAHALQSSTNIASALSSSYEKIHAQIVDNDLRELSETKAEVPETPELERSVMNLTCFTHRPIE